MTQQIREATRRPVRRGALYAGVVIAASALVLSGCDAGGGGGSGDSEGDFDFTGKDVGAMSDYGVGDTFSATEPVEFGLFYRDHPNYPLKEDWLILQELEEKQSVTFDMVSAPLSEWDQRKSLVIGAGDAPEIISVTYPGQEVAFVSGGAILPASDFVQYMPHYMDKVEKWDLEPDLDQMRQEDGKYYVFPGFREEPRAEYSFAVRSDVWEELGLSLEPATFDELRDQLRTVKEAYPDVYPMTDRWSANGPLEATLSFVSPNFGTSAGWGFGEGLTWNGDEFVYTGASDEYRDLIEFYASLVEEGLLDPEAVTQDDDQAVQKFASGNAMSIATNDQEIVRYRTTVDELGSDVEMTQIRVPAGPAGDNFQAGQRTVGGFMLSAKAAESENFLAMLQFLDWLYYSDEGLEFAKWGVEGETYTKDADGTRVLAENITAMGLNPEAPENLQADYGFSNGVWTLVHGSTVELDRSMLRPEVIDFVEAMSTKEVLELPPPAPLSEVEREQVSLYQSALKDHVWQNTAAFILGQRSLDEWDSYVAELEGMNMPQYLELVNGAQQRYADAN
ncbi:extracellular solute-binding protein [Microbacterium sp. zg.Y1090]|uniref:ABC transporter substrate-binding protein n=1 Tax=Microbacterium wangruii TaxID=3049073 RepID=UPI00214DA9CF|nr:MULTISPECIES: extracellular solute-binding protein [unclassified Microbacterium]MCR2819668.1 extracellular solute-binding protein [Microbacterium sp. zg.Y1090]MDL5487516.1 extracellular solute-binding protein [Microbacterium sp. zg-Y1211]WIM28088.1 extracellular solute-binding protein [Microbacterium sp. zg-Y1090]